MKMRNGEFGIMEKIKGIVKEKRFWVFVTTTALWAFINFLCVRCGDDQAIFDGYANSSLLSGYKNMVSLKTSWSSRFIIDFVMLVLQARMSFSLWQILNTAVCVALVFVMDKIFNREKRIECTLIIVMAGFLFPYFFESTAGWIATTVTYWWTLFATAACLGILELSERNKKKTTLSFVAILFFGLLACENELSCTFVLVMAAAYLFLSILNKKIDIQSSALLAIAFFRLCVHLIWKKYGVRVASETANWFPDFVNLSFFQKIQIGITTTFHAIFIDYPLIPFLLCLAIAFLVFKKYSNILNRAVILFPLVLLGMSLVNNFFQLKESEQNFFMLISKLDSFYKSEYGSISNWSGKWTNYQQWAEPVLWTIALGCVLFSVITIAKTKREAILISAILFASLCSRIPMGLSPTNVASSWRTYTYLYYGILSVLFFYSMRIENLMRTSESENKSCGQNGKTLLWIFAISGLLNFFVTTKISFSIRQQVAFQGSISYKIEGKIMTVSFKDNGNFSEMSFPTWSDADGQDDIVWYEASRNGKKIWEVAIDLSRHPNYEKLTIHFYTESKCVAGKSFSIPKIE